MATKRLGFFVKFNPVVICDYPDGEVHAICISGERIGYISIINKGGKKTYTPFTTAGELPEAHCGACAAAALFTQNSGIPGDDFDVVENMRSANTREVSAEAAMKLLSTIMANRSPLH